MMKGALPSPGFAFLTIARCEFEKKKYALIARLGGGFGPFRFFEALFADILSRVPFEILSAKKRY